MHLIGITGGIATGKSTVTRRLRERGYTVIDSDVVAREVVQPGRAALSRIRTQFGQQVISQSGDLDRTALGDIIFGDEEKRKMLNAIIHPEIYSEIVRQAMLCLLRRQAIVFMDLPLLYESGAMLKFLSKIVVVSCQPEQQLERLMARNSLSLGEAEARIKSQMSLEEKCRRADFVVDNSGTVQETERQVDCIEEILCGKYKSWINRYLLVDAVVAGAGALFGWLLFSVPRLLTDTGTGVLSRL